MDLEDIHTGTVPEWSLNLEGESVRKAIDRSVDLKNTTRVCNNALKQFKRTRSDASRDGIKKAKELLEKGIPPHPIMKRFQSHQNSQDLEERDQFLERMRNFRPKETVFEAFSTSTKEGVRSHLDNGRTTDSAIALTSNSIMKNMRRQMKLAKQKTTSLIVAGSQIPDHVDPVAPVAPVAPPLHIPPHRPKARLTTNLLKRSPF